MARLALREWVAEYLAPGLDTGCGCCPADREANLDHLTEVLAAVGFTVPDVGHRRCDCGQEELGAEFERWVPPTRHFAGIYCRNADTPRIPLPKVASA